ncbi:transcriptional regulator, MerR family [Gleimia coleocanis DSM 15436]|uniref:Transcriptional regulator, MerR family n=1 Tax=Gleimia coleocanis DSM 15436 TaxID=525245 RepID=C0W1J0_9ACTO|nr:MerR family transcriptional regulator [Gleimia coleocanis]EEH63356.1 transcriptional regulator, MerR family [Gleimia coleocanis DSM 15436]
MSNAVKKVEESVSESVSWPQSVSHEPIYTIGQLIAEVQKEFPALSPSKMRYLEDTGLITPFRLPSGYRKYSLADVERVRYILEMQRDTFTPLKVILEKLSALDLGHEVEAVVPRTRVVAENGVVATPAKAFISVRELCDLTGVSKTEVEELTQIGLIAPDLAGYFPTQTIRVVQAILKLKEMGISSRLLRPVRTSADRHADLIEQIVSQTRARNRSNDREKAYAQSRELAVAVTELYQELLRVTVDRLNS